MHALSPEELDTSGRRTIAKIVMDDPFRKRREAGKLQYQKIYQGFLGGFDPRSQNHLTQKSHLSILAVTALITGGMRH